MKPNFVALHKKAKSYAHPLFKSGLNTYEVWLAYFACFVPAMVFTFAVCSFTMADLMRLQREPVRSTLARLGFNRNISRDIVFGSTLYGGIGMLHLFVEQGIAQIQLLVRHLRAQTTQGNLILIGLSWWHLIAGYSTSLWLHPASNISYVEYSWYTSLKEFLLYTDGTIHIPPEAFIHWQPLRGHGIAIIERLSYMDGVSRADLAACNRCRLYFGIIFLSEVITADGLTISRDAWTGTRPRYSPLL
jgi:hypothetical protein